MKRWSASNFFFFQGLLKNIKRELLLRRTEMVMGHKLEHCIIVKGRELIQKR